MMKSLSKLLIALGILGLTGLTGCASIQDAKTRKILDEYYLLATTNENQTVYYAVYRVDYRDAKSSDLEKKGITQKDLERAYNYKYGPLKRE